MGSTASVPQRDYYGADSMSPVVAGREYDWDNEPAEPRNAVVVVDGICQICRNITSHALRNGFRHYATGADLQESKERGCQLCMLIWTAIAEGRSRQGWSTLGDLAKSWNIELTEVTTSYGQVQLHLTCGLGVDSLETYLKLQALPSNSRYCNVDLAQKPTPGPEAEYSVLQGLHIFEDMTDPDSFQNAKLMIEHCEKEHPKCRREASNTYRLPTRVVDVGSATQSPFLKETQTDAGKWVTLSYCWGGSQSLVLRSETYDILKKGIDMAMLPKTVSDAILATRQLGIQYLWVDALCILQDSLQDWNIESMNMHRIYGESWATIAAKEAASSRVGLFLPARHLAPPCRLLYQTREFLVGEVVLSLEETQSHLPLFTRGWTLQERLLSPRVILWSPSSYSMECQSVEDQSENHEYRLEFRRRRLPDILMNTSPSKPKRYTFWEDEVFRAKQRIDNLVRAVTLYNCWVTILQDFWNRDLTYPTDRLAALAGIAQRFQRVTGDEYLGGLWRSQIQTCLSWYCERGIGPRRPDLGELQGPSWSWASAPIGNRPRHLYDSDSIRYGFDTIQKAGIELIQWDMKLKGANPFGEVSRGSLLLRCQSVVGTLEVHNAYFILPNRQRFAVHLDNPNFHLDPNLDDHRKLVETPVPHRYSTFHVDPLHHDHTLKQVPDAQPLSTVKCECVLLTTRSGLAIIPNRIGGSEYRRVGLVIHTFTETDLKNWYEVTPRDILLV
ncbi:heterokaryon incompatibility protein-domain-containing protein [Lophiotrema nucula]|uniref:Heterokaryon incompatibility protein-domain-containing protein n=1 Tax=Lophiotrema nucula TaxID=690887 RepID=A0A6A5ZIY4_9PLEO|nr:heterokaryon incompatibility protein-domain-containing protein [Lophiotrema nucula]